MSRITTSLVVTAGVGQEEGYFVDGTVTDKFTNADGQLIGVAVDGSNIFQPVGTSAGDSVNVTADHPEAPNAFMVEISRQLAPLNKLSDCAGEAAVNQVPFGSKIFGTPKGPSDPAGTGLDLADKLAEPKTAGRVSLALNKAGLPELSQTAGKGLAKVSGRLAPVAGKISVFGWVWSGYSFVRETSGCYNKPGG
jgi:hypothetical protein